MRVNQARLNDFEWLSIVPAGGLGTRLQRLTENRAKPSLAVAFDTDGTVTRMIDIPLRAIREAGGAAVVTRCFARETLDFVKAYDHVETVMTCIEDSPIDTLLFNMAIIENSTAKHVGLIPGDTHISSQTLGEMRSVLEKTGADAVLLATQYLPGHNIRSVDEGSFLCLPEHEVNRIGDLGIHMFRRDWLLERLRECLRDNPDDPREVWNDIYDVQNPQGRVYLYIPEPDIVDVDMGTPVSFRRIVEELNEQHKDSRGNIIFPGASLHPDSTDCIALPGSTAAEPLKRAVIPEEVTVASFGDYLEV